MRVLVISHNAIGPSTNVGITLKNILQDFGAENVAELFIRNEEPTDTEVCENYFRITDKEVMKSVFFRKKTGRAFGKDDVEKTKNKSKNKRESSAIEKIRTMHRNAWLDMGRELYWSLSPWYSKDLQQWLKKMNPDIIYFAAGDYAFSYKIALKIAKELNIPLIVACYDDFFFYIKDGDSFMGKIHHFYYMKKVKKAMDYASKIITICEPMAEDYRRLFGKECMVLYTPAVPRDVILNEEGKTICYFGTLGLGRDDQIVSIGRAVENTANITGFDHIDVYTSEKRDEALAKMIPKNGIKLHKAVPFEEMLNIYKDSVALIHTESFDSTIRKRVKYSVSTKIPEALSYGPCLFAYGPAEIASIDYLKKNNVAYVVTEESELETRIIELLEDKAKRKKVISNARVIAAANHNSNVNHDKLQACFENAIKDHRQFEGERRCN